MNGISRLGVAACLGCAIGLCACSDNGETKTDGGGPSGGEVTFGLILPLSGEDENMGKAQRQAAELAAEEIKGGGGILEKLEIKYELVDEESADLETTVKGWVDGDKVIGIVGPGFSGTSATIMPTIKGKVATISASATNPALSEADDGGYYWRTAPSDAHQSKAAAKYAKEELSATKAAIIYRDDAYGKALGEAFAAAFKDVGGEILATVAYPDEEDYSGYDFGPNVAEAFADGPELVFMVTYGQDGAKLISAVASDDGYLAVKDTVKFLGCDGQTTPDFFGGADPTVIEGRFFGTLPGPPKSDPDYKAYSAAFKAKFGTSDDPVTYTEGFYDGVYLLAYAIENAKSAERAALNGGLSNVSGPDGETIGVGQWAKGKAAAAAGKINYEGASGQIDWDANGDPLPNYSIYTIKGGALEILDDAYSY